MSLAASHMGRGGGSSFPVMAKKSSTDYRDVAFFCPKPILEQKPDAEQLLDMQTQNMACLEVKS